MKHLFIALFFIYFLFPASGQNNVVKTAGVSYTAGAPTFSPGRTGSQVAIDTVTGYWYEYNGTSWSASGYRVQTISGCSAPAYTPAKYQSRLVINACSAGQGGPELYYYTGSAWLQINEGQTYTAGTGISISGGNVISSTVTGGIDSTWRKRDDSYLYKRITDTIERTAPAVAPIWDNGGAVFNVAAYNIFPNGTDQTAKFNALLAKMDTIGGGEIVFGNGTYKFDGRIVFPGYSTTASVNMAPITIKGVGSISTGRGYSAPTTGTVWELNYTSSDTTKSRIVSNGAGQISVSDINFYALSTTNNTAIWLTTNAVLKIKNCGFFSPQSGASCRIDAFLLGAGTTSYTTTSTDTSAFQGYGTVIESNYFNGIQRGAYFRTFCNNVVFQNNNFWNRCGGLCAVELNNFAPGQSVTANVIANNLIEVGAYKYGMRITGGNKNTFLSNGFFDSDAINTLGCYWFSSDGGYNIVISGMEDARSIMIGPGAIYNTMISATQGIKSYFPQKIEMPTAHLTEPTQWAKMIQTDTDYFSFRDFAANDFNIMWSPAAGPEESLIKITRSTSAIKRFAMDASTSAFFENTTGAMRFQPNTKELWLSNNKFYSIGDATLYAIGQNQSVYKATNTGRFSWSGTASAGAGADLEIGRLASGHLGIFGNGTTQSTGAIRIPSGTTAQRPASLAAGDTRFCADCTATDGSAGVMQVYNGTTWKNAW